MYFNGSPWSFTIVRQTYINKCHNRCFPIINGGKKTQWEKKEYMVSLWNEESYPTVKIQTIFFTVFLGKIPRILSIRTFSWFVYKSHAMPLNNRMRYPLHTRKIKIHATFFYIFLDCPHPHVQWKREIPIQKAPFILVLETNTSNCVIKISGEFSLYISQLWWKSNIPHEMKSTDTILFCYMI